MILVIDNYDSFTFNLVQMIGSVTKEEIIVKRNDEITVEEVYELAPTHIVISPGPGRPAEAGICKKLLLKIKDIPILGVCLGHQAICEVFGGEVVKAKELMHGKSSEIKIDNTNKLFTGMEEIILVGRYHSLIGERLPDCLDIIGTSLSKEVMAVCHKDYPVYGVQFHPESILTENGDIIIRNFLEI
ncbi:MAG: aminodeoxychorismate/anthranilate synthase component II [Candidatus Epulonipiscium fishelsonii]|nr:MAG: aminodeoxychorismate/anthranilate synthase component II [Epulopiscium sp. AS2M-Bin002]